MKTIAIILLTFVFNSCMFAQKNNSSSKIIKASQIEKALSKNDNIYYYNVKIEGNIDFIKFADFYTEGINAKRADISSSITFINCTFLDEIIAYGRNKKDILRINFLKNLTFINCNFRSDFVIKEAIIHGIANFSKSSFEGVLDIEGADFRNKDNYFIECVFDNQLKSQRTRFNGNISFLKSEFHALANFQQAVFNGNAQFGACKFNDNVDLSLIKVNDDFIMNYATFKKKALMNNSNYLGRVEFQQASFMAPIEMEGNTYAHPVNFNNAIIKSDFSVENSRFLSGQPEINNVKTKDGIFIDFSKSKISTIKTNK